MISYIHDHTVPLAGVDSIEFELELIPKFGLVKGVTLEAVIHGKNGMSVHIPAESFDFKCNFSESVELIMMNLELMLVDAGHLMNYLHQRSREIESRDYTREIES